MIYLSVMLFICYVWEYLEFMCFGSVCPIWTQAEEEGIFSQ